MSREKREAGKGEARNANEDLSLVQRAERRRWHWRLLMVGFAALVLFGVRLHRQFALDAPVRYADIREHFKYGSMGSEPANGIPYYVWMVMPELCADKLPRPGGGYESLGFIFEPSKELPVGTSVRRVGVDRVGFNCALCHAGSVRHAPEQPRQLYLAMPANNFSLYDYVKFFSECAQHPRFTPNEVMALIERRYTLGWLERLLYRYVVVEATRRGLMEQAAKLSFLGRQPAWGPGRVDTFNPYKTLQFNFDMSQDTTIGTTDFPSIWNQEPREQKQMQLHWDGNNRSVHERNLSAALGVGVRPPTLDCEALTRIEDWLMTLPAPRYPFPVDPGRATRGKEVFKAECARCHDFNGEFTGKVTPLSQIGTDRERLDTWSYELLSNFNTLYSGYAGEQGAKECRHVFTQFRKTDGYANMPLDGIWLRAPYLHNGSVPTLMDLLKPPDERPRSFFRGNDVYDPKNVGFVSTDASDGKRQFFNFDTALRGNSNQGHRYGTHLEPERKLDLLEFLKTL